MEISRNTISVLRTVISEKFCLKSVRPRRRCFVTFSRRVHRVFQTERGPSVSPYVCHIFRRPIHSGNFSYKSVACVVYNVCRNALGNNSKHGTFPDDIFTILYIYI